MQSSLFEKVALLVATVTLQAGLLVPTTTAASGRGEVVAAPCHPIAADSRRTGCIVLGRLELGAPLHPPLYWYIDLMPTLATAREAEATHSMAFESHGKVWLFTIAA